MVGVCLRPWNQIGDMKTQSNSTHLGRSVVSARIVVGVCGSVHGYIYTVYIYGIFWLGNHQIYGVHLRLYTVLANPIYNGGRSRSAFRVRVVFLKNSANLFNVQRKEG